MIKNHTFYSLFIPAP